MKTLNDQQLQQVSGAGLWDFLKKPFQSRSNTKSDITKEKATTPKTYPPLPSQNGVSNTLYNPGVYGGFIDAGSSHHHDHSSSHHDVSSSFGGCDSGGGFGGGE